ncbi:MAG: hypothetical protein ACU837_13455 [Gammaproteobacteria bacterium]
MPLSAFLESLFKWLFLLGAVTMSAAYFYKDKLPEAEFYDPADLGAPRQTPATVEPFEVRVNEQNYSIYPLFDYELDGVVISLHDADAFSDIWHHKRWQDFLNLRDLCVIWGTNVASGVYRNMEFNNDSWTCWASWPDKATGDTFKMNALSNNHLLTASEAVAAALMAAESGDHIRLKGVLAQYANKGNGFRRGTSITRDDTGNGACETIFLHDFTILNKANRKIRRLYSFAKGLTIVAGIGFVLMFLITPVKAVR